jgi:hypothetical protein
MTEQEIKVVRMIIVEELEKRGLNSFSTTASMPYSTPSFETIVITNQGDRYKFLSRLSESEPLIGSEGNN